VVTERSSTHTRNMADRARTTAARYAQRLEASGDRTAIQTTGRNVIGIWTWRPRSSCCIPLSTRTRLTGPGDAHVMRPAGAVRRTENAAIRQAEAAGVVTTSIENIATERRASGARPAAGRGRSSSPSAI
jgi:hypothetical protein